MILGAISNTHGLLRRDAVGARSDAVGARSVALFNLPF
jgi:hypothetical protein